MDVAGKCLSTFMLRPENTRCAKAAIARQGFSGTVICVVLRANRETRKHLAGKLWKPRLASIHTEKDGQCGTGVGNVLPR